LVIEAKAFFVTTETDLVALDADSRFI